MKRHGNLYDKVCSMDNLYEAHRHARKDKLYYKEVRMVDKDPETYLRQIQEMLLNKTYEVSPYAVSELKDRGKKRDLWKLPYFPDRIIQWAIMLHMESIFHEVFTSFTCASLVGRGIHRASNLCTKYMKDKEGTRYCLKFDIAKFYPNIDQTILKSLLRKKVKDKDLLWLLDAIVDSMPGVKGVPIGSYLSQYLANFYLAYFDHWLKEVMGVKYVVRYMDDVVIFHSSKEFLHRLRIQIEEYLSENLKLTLKHDWQVFPTSIRGVDFVGYRHFYGYKLLRKKTCKRFKRTMRNTLKKWRRGCRINFKEYCSCNSYVGWLMWCDGYCLTCKYLVPLEPAVKDYYDHVIKTRKESKAA